MKCWNNGVKRLFCSRFNLNLIIPQSGGTHTKFNNKTTTLLQLLFALSSHRSTWSAIIFFSLLLTKTFLSSCWGWGTTHFQNFTLNGHEAPKSTRLVKGGWQLYPLCNLSSKEVMNAELTERKEEEKVMNENKAFFHPICRRRGKGCGYHYLGGVDFPVLKAALASSSSTTFQEQHERFVPASLS